LFAALEDKYMLLAIHHVQLAMPAGQEDIAREFYVGVLGLREVAKPDAMQGRGGCWFEAGEARVHLGVESAFVAAAKAHPAFLVDLDAMVARLAEAGIETKPDEDYPGFRRVYVSDPFGNRIELLERV
jgi:catechol 2,3-dioxygenase-like lactoylglutathione lyase family enzyme